MSNYSFEMGKNILLTFLSDINDPKPRGVDIG